MPSQIITVTLQAALFSALSTTLAQSITAYNLHTQTLESFSSSKNNTTTTSPYDPHSPPSATQSLRSTFNLYSLVTFMVIAVIVTPPNYLYQRFLEDTFPSRVATVPRGGKRKGRGDDDKGKSKREVQVRGGDRLSKSNTLAKFCLDQSLGAMVNTAAFIILAGLAKGRSVSDVFGTAGDLQRDFLPMLLASWRVWPTVTLLNLIVVPFDYRMIVGNLVGVCWGVYVTLQTM